MDLQWGTLEEVHGGPFGTRLPVTREQQKDKSEPLAKAEFTSLAQRSAESIAKNKDVIASVAGSLPLDRTPTTETFVLEQPAPVPPPSTQQRRRSSVESVRERFVDRATSHADAAAEEKLSRILRLIEQNRTGYERPAIQDMVLYIFTGIFFLFTFDTFVQLGKSMRPPKRVGRKGSQRT